jgi:hypothetical protein
VLTLTPGITSYIENSAPVAIDPGALFDNAGTFNGNSLVISLSNVSADHRLGILKSSGTTGISIDGEAVTYNGVKIGTSHRTGLGVNAGLEASTFVITFDATTATPITAPIVQALLRSLTYSNSSENLLPTAIANPSGEIAVQIKNGAAIVAEGKKSIRLDGVNDAPTIGRYYQLYDASTNLRPDQVGSAGNTTLAPSTGTWFSFQNSAVAPLSQGAVTSNVVTNGNLNLAVNTPAFAGYSNYQVNVPSAFSLLGGAPITTNILNTNTPILDRTQGYTFSFTGQVLSESRDAGSDKNGDGKDDRGGFIVTLNGNDKKGIELEFWTNRIWARDDGTTQIDPSIQAEPGTVDRTLFAQAEYVDISNDGGNHTYDITLKGNIYTVYVDGVAKLSGRIRDYVASGQIRVGPVNTLTPNVYDQPNLIFFGDKNPNAQSSVSISKVSLTTNEPLPIRSIATTPIILNDIAIGDAEAQLALVEVTLTGLVGSNIQIAPTAGVQISGSGGRSVVLSGTTARINAALRTGISYAPPVATPPLTTVGSQTLTIVVNDLGQGGNGPVSTTKIIGFNSTAEDAPIINSSPVLSASQLTTGLPLAVIFEGKITDPDVTFNPIVSGFAITSNSANPSQGVWEYQAPGNTNWTAIGPITGGQVLTLGATIPIRFRPAIAFSGAIPPLVVKAIDSTILVMNGALITPTANQLALYSQSETITSIIPANPPSLSGNAILSPDQQLAGNLLFALFGGKITDPDFTSFPIISGFAVTNNPATTAQGVWEFKTIGSSTWTAIGTLTANQARILDPNFLIRFRPAIAFSGPAPALTVKAIDSTISITPGQVITPSTNELAFYSEARTIGVTILANPPSLSGNAILSPDQQIAGNLLFALFANKITDPDFASSYIISGFAITNNPATTNQGVWEYKNVGASLWTAIGTLAPNQALTLEETSLIRFRPARAFSGPAPALTVKAIDSTIPITPGQVITPSTNELAFYSEARTIGVTILANPPSLSGNAILSPDQQIAGNLLFALFANKITDPDFASSYIISGFAITNNPATANQGVWEYKNVGASLWTTIGTLAPNQALTLEETSLIRFRPARAFSGPAPALTVKAIDSTIPITPGQVITPSTNELAFYSEARTIGVTILANPPSLSGNAILSPNQQVAGDSISALFAGKITDPDFSSFPIISGFAVTNNPATPAQGVWEYKIVGSSLWTAIGTLTANQALILEPNSSIRFRPAIAFSGPAPALTVKAIDSTIPINPGIVITPSTNELAFYSEARTIEVTIPITTGRTATALASIVFRTTGGRLDFTGTAANETLYGSKSDDIINGGDGDDWIGGGGCDFLIQLSGRFLWDRDGNDRFDGGAGNDELYGYGGNDELKGGSGDDRLDGGRGNDILIGGTGLDTLVGGFGIDTFTINAIGEGLDTILDFEVGIDLIDLRGIFAGSAFAGTSTFARYQQFVTIVQSGTADSLVNIDSDGLGSGTAQTTLFKLIGVTAASLTSESFIIANTLP